MCGMLAELPLGRIVLRILIGALCVAAIVASYSLLGGEFSDTDWKVIDTAIFFALPSSMAAAGLACERARLLGAATVVAASAAFVLVSFGMWVELDSEALLAGHGHRRHRRPRVGTRRLRLVAPTPAPIRQRCPRHPGGDRAWPWSAA